MSLPAFPGYEELELQRCLRRGVYGAVYKVWNLMWGTPMVFKRYRRLRKHWVPSTTVREALMLREVKHRNIIYMHVACVHDDITVVVEDFVGNNLQLFIQDYGPVPKRWREYFMYSILDALSCCHRMRIVHRDLKPENILLTARNVVKITGFGLGRWSPVPVHFHPYPDTTLRYRAPEILLGISRYGPEIDIWSAGCIFIEMVTAHVLFRGTTPLDQLFKIYKILSTPTVKQWPKVAEIEAFKFLFPQWKRNRLNRLRMVIGDTTFNMILKMLDYDPEKRISAKELMEDPTFHDPSRFIPEYSDEE